MAVPLHSLDTSTVWNFRNEPSIHHPKRRYWHSWPYDIAVGLRREGPDSFVKAVANARRRQRYIEQHALRSHSVRGGARSCLDAIAGGVEVELHESGRLTVSGTKRCGSAAACPICGENIRQQRATEIDQIISAAKAEGHHVFLVTATVKHRSSDELTDLIGGVQRAWSAAWSGRGPKDNGYIGQARAWDYTLGRYGWHPHIHSVVVMSKAIPYDFAYKFVDDRFALYKASLKKHGLDARKSIKRFNEDGTTVQESVGWDVRPVNDDGQVVAEYVAGISKLWSAGAEIALTTHKKSSVSQWAILRAATSGEVIPNSVVSGWTVKRLWASWREYEVATKGRQQIVIGAALRDFVTDDVEDDEDAAHGVDGTPVVFSVNYPHDVWMEHLNAGVLYLLLEFVEITGADRLPELAVAG